MKVIESLEFLESAIDGETVVSIGNFDGVHLGHRALIELNKNVAAERNLSSVIVTFEPHPMTYFNSANRLRRLTPPKDKLELLAEENPDFVVLIHFNRIVAEMEAEEFLEEIVHKRIKGKSLVVGEDFALGKGRKGNINILKEICTGMGIDVRVYPPVEMGGEKISSSRIRFCVERGDVSSAAAMLGRRYFMCGTVVRGRKIGSRWGVPTLNIDEQDRLWPADGVYACIANIDKRKFRAVVNIGYRPTFGGEDRVVEVHLLDFRGGDLYGKEVKVEFVDRIRPEIKFDNPRQLFVQIKRDIEKAKEILA